MIRCCQISLIIYSRNTSLWNTGLSFDSSGMLLPFKLLLKVQAMPISILWDLWDFSHLSDFPKASRLFLRFSKITFKISKTFWAIKHLQAFMIFEMFRDLARCFMILHYYWDCQEFLVAFSITVWKDFWYSLRFSRRDNLRS